MVTGCANRNKLRDQAFKAFVQLTPEQRRFFTENFTKDTYDADPKLWNAERVERSTFAVEQWQGLFGE